MRTAWFILPGVTILDVINNYAAAMRSGDYETGFGYFADDIVGHVPGRSRLAGDRHGRAEVEAYIRAVIDSAKGDIELVLVDTLVGAEHVALMVIEKLGSGADRVEIHRTNVYRIVGDRIVEIRIFEGDQYLVDDYKSRQMQ